MGVSFCYCSFINGCNRVRSLFGVSCVSFSIFCCFSVFSVCFIIVLRSDFGVIRKRNCSRFSRFDCVCYFSYFVFCV